MTDENVVFEKDGWKVIAEQDEFAESPREGYDLGRMLCFHRRYTLGDKPNVLAKGRGNGFSGIRTGDFNGWVEMEAHLTDPANGYDVAVILNLYLYDHSGLSMSTGSFGCRWDSGQVGFIIATKEDVEAEYGDLSQESIEKATKCLEAEVEHYDHYLRGNVHVLTVIDPNGVRNESCGGFFGWTSDAHIVDEAEAMLGYAMKWAAKKAQDEAREQEAWLKSL